MSFNFNTEEKDLLSNNTSTPKEDEGFPIQQTAVKDMINSFNLAYKSSFINKTGSSEVINQNILNIVLKIKVSTIVEFLKIDNIYNLNHGVAFYNIIYTDNAQNDFFTYAVTPAIYNSSTNKIEPKPNESGNIEYLVLTPDDVTNGKLISDNDFKNIHQKKYFDVVKLREFSLSQTFLAITLNSLTTKEHPTNCFYSDQQIYYFYDHNKGVANSPELFYLTIINGAMYADYNNPLTNQYFNFKVQRPILIFEYDKKRLSDDNVLNPQKFYYYKALDVGRLCPPDC